MTRNRADDRPLSTRPSARFSDAPHLVALRGRAAEPALRPPPRASGLEFSLQSKILGGYLMVGVVLVVAVPLVNGWLAERLVRRRPTIVPITLALGYVLTLGIARVSRVGRLKASAVEISRGDLSRAVLSEEQRQFHDEIDDLTQAIRTMQENLRDLVSRIQRTAQSVLGERQRAAALRRGRERLHRRGRLLDGEDRPGRRAAVRAGGADLQGHRRDRRLHRAHRQERRGRGPRLGRDQLLGAAAAARRRGWPARR